MNSEVSRWEGRWWPKGETENAVSGTLRQESARSFVLELHSSFTPSHPPFYLPSPLTIYGVTIDGSQFTLELLAVSGLHSSGFGRRSTYTVGRLIKGSQLPDLNPIVHSVEFGLTRLHSWLAPEVFHVDQQFGAFPYRARIDLTYTSPEPILLAQLEGFAIYVFFWSNLPMTTPRDKSVEIEHHCGIRIDGTRRHRLSTFLPIVEQTRALIAFATANPCSVTYLVAHQKRDATRVLEKQVEHERRLEFFPVSRPQDAPSQEPLLPHSMLFTYADDQLIEGAAVEAWFEGWPKLGPLVELFLGANQGDEIYQEHRFLSLVQALEGWHRLNYSNCKVPKSEHKGRVVRILKSIPEADLEFVRANLQYSNEPSLRDRLMELATVAHETLPECIENKKAFVDAAVASRHYLSHLAPHLQERAASNWSLYRLCYSLSWTFEILMLLKLGFPEDIARKIMGRSFKNRRYKGPARFLLEKR